MITQAPLLPPGFSDTLPPAARRQRRLVNQLLDYFEGQDFLEVAPPMIEYTDTLLSGQGSAYTNQLFRVMDGTAQPMAIRADMTPQISRIVRWRLADMPRPLRLSYSGTVLRQQPAAGSTLRQLRQVGIEIIGQTSGSAEQQAILVAIGALQAIGLVDLTLDLHLPGLVPAALACSGASNDEAEAMIRALEHKDESTLKQFSHPLAKDLLAILVSADSARQSLDVLRAIEWPDAVGVDFEAIAALIETLESTLNNQVTISLDATDLIGHNFYTGLAFSLFDNTSGTEVGRGGCYVLESSDEPAVGASLYVDALV